MPITVGSYVSPKKSRTTLAYLVKSLDRFESAGQIIEVVKIHKPDGVYTMRLDEVELHSEHRERKLRERQARLDELKQQKVLTAKINHAKLIANWKPEISNRDLAEVLSMTTLQVVGAIRKLRNLGILPDKVSDTSEDLRASVTPDGTVRMD